MCGRSESEWSQQQLAEYLSKRWGKDVSRSYICQRLMFGRFLQFFVATGNKDGAPAAHFSIPKNLTERRFRAYWEQTTAEVSNRGHKAQSKAAVS